MFHTVAVPRFALLIALVALLAVPASASAAVSLGQTARAGLGCDGNAAIAQTASGAPEYTVRIAGVITELRTEDVAVAGRRLHVFRPRGSNSYAVLASAPVTPGSGVVRVPVRVPVQPGDVLGLSTGPTPDPHPNCQIPGSNASTRDVVAYRNTAPAPDSGEVTLTDADIGRLNVAATLEPDGDSDGFGDETQDQCGDDPTRTAQPCSADLLVTQLPVETDIERDDVNVITIFVRNNGTSLARDVRVTAPLPPGLQLVTATPSSGTCAAGAPLDCTLPTVATGATGYVLAVVRATSTGDKAFTATATSRTPDPNEANNSSTLQFDVKARRSVVSPGAFCRVPRLLGLSRTSARRALEAAGCRLGLTSRRRFRSGRVSRVKLQSIPARVRVATGTRVNITLRRR